VLREYGKNVVNEKLAKRREYFPPRLTVYGQLGDLTRAAGSVGYEANCGNAASQPGTRSCSDRSTKRNIVYIGNHPFGIGLYLFDYKPEFRDTWGHGRQLGVMADEVEKVMPEAVSMHPDGYKMVDYAMLGINRNLH
jgi:hypothetical protein